MSAAIPASDAVGPSDCRGRAPVGSCGFSWPIHLRLCSLAGQLIQCTAHAPELHADHSHVEPSPPKVYSACGKAVLHYLPILCALDSCRYPTTTTTGDPTAIPCWPMHAVYQIWAPLCLLRRDGTYLFIANYLRELAPLPIRNLHEFVHATKQLALYPRVGRARRLALQSTFDPSNSTDG